MVSAEERQWGTLESQLLLPVSAAQQWAIKIAAALVVSVVVAVGLPLLLALVIPMGGGYLFLLSDEPWTNMEFAVLLTSVGIYASSVSRGGLRALLAAMATAAVGTVVLQFWAQIVSLILREVWPIGKQIGPTAVGFVISRMYAELWLGGLGVLALWFAFRNHCYGAISRRRIAGQVVWMLAWYTGVIATFGILTRFWP